MRSNNSISIAAIATSIAVAAAAYLCFFIVSDWNSIKLTMGEVHYKYWLQVLLCASLSYILRFLRWHLFIVSLKKNIPISKNISIYLSAFALTLTPGKAGEMIRSFFLTKYSVSYAESIGAFIAERLMDLFAVVLFVLVGGMLIFDKVWYLNIIIFFILAFFVLFKTDYLLRLFQWRKLDATIINLQRLMHNIKFFLATQHFVVVVLLSLMAWAAQGFGLWLIVNALGVELPVFMVIAIYSMSILFGAASFVPGGLGVTELTITSLLVLAGVGQSDAIIAAFISRGLTLWFAVVIGVVALILISIRE